MVVEKGLEEVGGRSGGEVDGEDGADAGDVHWGFRGGSVGESMGLGRRVRAVRRAIGCRLVGGTVRSTIRGGMIQG